ncbi:beta-ketoacyl synthase, partial [Streptomyces anulatus]
MTVLEFDGIPFDPMAAPGGPPAASVTGIASVPRSAAVAPMVSAGSATAPARPTDRTADVVSSVSTAEASAVDPITEIRAGVVAAHRSALTAQVALQRGILRQALRRTGSDDPVLADTTAAAPTATVRVAPEGSFKALARTDRVRLDRVALERLIHGEVAAVFGGGYHRAGVEPTARLAATTTLVLSAVSRVELYGGHGNGFVRAYFDGDVRAAALQAAEVFALYTGMPLCISGSTLTGDVTGSSTGSTTGTVELVVEALGLVPRPHLVATASFGPEIDPVGVTVAVTEPDGVDLGPGVATGAVLLNEFHMAHLARGDQGIAMGQEFAEYTGMRATRVPTGGLLLVDRVRDFDGARGNLDSATYTTEYDSPADS